MSAEVRDVSVYVIHEDYPGSPLVKVGVSKHPDQRCLTLQREHERNLYVASVTRGYGRSDAMAIERRAHLMLAEWCVGGEWFDCGLWLAKAAVVLAAGPKRKTDDVGVIL